MAPPARLQNPYEEAQCAVLGRILVNVDKLNEALLELTKSLGEVTAHNQQIAVTTEHWNNYARNVHFNLESQGNLQDPV